jgi:ferrous iron transport protein B
VGGRSAADLAAWTREAARGWSQARRAQLAQIAPGCLALVEGACGRRTFEDPAISAAAEGLAALVRDLSRIDADRRREQLRHSIAGRLGRLIEPVSLVAGLDWRDNVALVGGVAAKEVIVSTLGMAYSMGDATPGGTDGDSRLPLVRALQDDPGWSALRAFVLILFVMLYAPCLVTVVTIGRESGSWKWALFSTCYSTAIAFVTAAAVYRIGMALGIGV